MYILTWQLVSPNKVPINVTVLIRMLFVLALDDHIVIGGLDGQFVWFELLDVQDQLNKKR